MVLFACFNKFFLVRLSHSNIEYIKNKYILSDTFFFSFCLWSTLWNIQEVLIIRLFRFPLKEQLYLCLLQRWHNLVCID